MKPVLISNLSVYPFSSKSELIDYIQDKKKILIAINAEKILNADKMLVDLINRNIGYTDGIGAVLAVKKKGRKTIKIAGVELWLDIIKYFCTSKTFYLIGSTDEVIEKTIEKLKIVFSCINVVGYRDGFIKNDDEKFRLVTDIKIKKPDVIFVAMGSPKQEYLMAEMYEHYPALYMGLGGSFDIYSGAKKRAPGLFLEANLEWFFRLIKEPLRIKRQIRLIKFVYLILLNRI